MALILEIRDRHGRPTFHPLTALPLRIGRGMSNDIILDDPYLDAQHFTIDCDDTGVLSLRDLGSVNGIIDGGKRIAGVIGIAAGSEVLAGRTTFRFHDPDEAVAPALVNAAPNTSAEKRVAISTLARWGIVAVTLCVIGFVTWLGSFDRNASSTVLSAVFGAGAMLFVWAGIWGLSLRGPERRVQLGSHIALASLAVLAVMIYGLLNGWLVFMFPDVELLSVLFLVAMLAAMSAVIAGHLWIGTGLSRRQRWRAGLIASGTVFVLTMAVGWSQADKFSDTPKFANTLKPMRATLVPTRSVDEFVKAMSQAKDEADKAVAKGKTSDGK